ncbi:hypothetical protein HPB52_012279 [Rhipicephalus sanguineus]|uniref:EF-hand domain-containing protein n=1 Tax=Rhipicephalus sanguineus TaxID=34632 RepID=A0A9D4Q950_RHISA|nr:hypothetical protein HPB52_012279 [Rhipicephalus sanguineus]
MSSAAEEAPVIPLFYFPYGRPLSPLEVEMACRELKLALNDIAGDVLGPEDFAPLARACSLPGYFKTALYRAAGGDKDRPVTKERFCRYYSHLVANFPEESSRAVHVLARDRDYLTQEDLRPLFEDFFAMHPDMRFLQKTPQFREPFIATALTKESHLLSSLRWMEESSELDQSMDAFNFGSFYMTYAMFEGLDRDRDGMLSPDELRNFQGGAFTNRGLDRILCSAVIKRQAHYVLAVISYILATYRDCIMTTEWHY